MTLYAIVLAGGGSRRMGRPKAALRLRGNTLLHRSVEACLAHGCTAVAVVAPEAAREWTAPHPQVRFALEDPPDGGPVAGIAAGLAELRPGHDDDVLVLACDLPHAPELVALLATDSHPPLGPQTKALIPVDSQGWPQWLAARYRAQALRHALDRPEGVRDISVRRALGVIPHHPVDIPDELLTDVDTPEQARDAGISAASGHSRLVRSRPGLTR